MTEPKKQIQVSAERLALFLLNEIALNQGLHEATVRQLVDYINPVVAHLEFQFARIYAIHFCLSRSPEIQGSYASRCEEVLGLFIRQARNWAQNNGANADDFDEMVINRIEIYDIAYDKWDTGHRKRSAGLENLRSEYCSLGQAFCSFCGATTDPAMLLIVNSAIAQSIVGVATLLKSYTVA